MNNMEVLKLEKEIETLDRIYIKKYEEIQKIKNQKLDKLKKLKNHYPKKQYPPIVYNFDQIKEILHR